MEEQFILRVPPSVSERIDRLLSEEASTSDEIPLDLCFSGSVPHQSLSLLAHLIEFDLPKFLYTYGTFLNVS